MRFGLKYDNLKIYKLIHTLQFYQTILYITSVFQYRTTTLKLFKSYKYINLKLKY